VRVSLLHLAQDFGFADHHGVEPSDHAKEMLRAGFPVIAIKCLGVLDFNRPPAALQTTKNFIRRHRPLRGTVDLDAIAGLQN
jgi:hypothetical protein